MRTPSSLRRPAGLFFGLVAFACAASLVTPWQQTAFGDGRVVAYSPLEREQRLEAPLDARVLRWHVAEGAQVNAGDPIVDLIDNDEGFVARLERERVAVQARVDAAEARIVATRSRLVALENSRRAAKSAAEARVKMAGDRLVAATTSVEAAHAAARVADANLERQRALLEKGLTSTRALELAQLDHARAATDLPRAEATVEAARGDRTAAEADRARIDADTLAAIADAQATLSVASVEAANASAELARIETRVARQGEQHVKAPRGGVMHRIVARTGGDFVKAGETLAVIVPDASHPAVELWVDGRDVPLLRAEGEVRLQFEGWPAVQFSGWPSVAVGTFGGRVAFIDPTDDGKGQFRVVVVPGSGESWPTKGLLRQGGRAHAWFMLGQVSIAYELWRQFNGFPPALAKDPKAGGSS